VLADAAEEHTSSLEHALISAALSDLLDVGEVGAANELLKL
jgi:hypothetical protein